MHDCAHPHDAASIADKPTADMAATPAEENAAATAEHDIGSAKTHVPQITLITKRDTPALMSKRISLDGEGKLKSDGSECRMITGTAARAFAATASALAQIIASCRSEQAIALGTLKPELSDCVAVTIPNRLDKHPRRHHAVAQLHRLSAWSSCLVSDRLRHQGNAG